MSEQALPCIVCDAPLKNVFNDSVNQPSGGTVFTSTGNYGSTVWDTVMGDMYLTVNICDDCMRSRATQQKILFNQSRRLIGSPDGNIIGHENIEREPTPWVPTVIYDASDDMYTVGSLDDFERITEMRTRYGHPKVTWHQGIRTSRKMVEEELKNDT